MFRDWMLRARALLKRSAVESDIDEELRFHIDRQVEWHMARGLSRADAVRRARVEFGGLDQVKEEYRDALGVRLVEGCWRDLRLAVRTLRATPVVTVVAILSLALGIGRFLHDDLIDEQRDDTTSATLEHGVMASVGCVSGLYRASTS